MKAHQSLSCIAFDPVATLVRMHNASLQNLHQSIMHFSRQLPTSASGSPLPLYSNSQRNSHSTRMLRRSIRLLTSAILIPPAIRRVSFAKLNPTNVRRRTLLQMQPQPATEPVHVKPHRGARMIPKNFFTAMPESSCISRPRTMPAEHNILLPSFLGQNHFFLSSRSPLVRGWRAYHR